jgi:tetratricopeptide (TPR) repeat protein
MMTAAVSIIGFPQDSLQFLQEGEKLSKELRDEKSLAIFFSMLGAYYQYAGQHTLKRQYAEKGLEVAKELEDVELLSRISFNVCSNYFSSGLWEKVINVATPALRLMESTGTELTLLERGLNVYSMLSGFLGMALGMLGKFEDALLHCEKGLKNISDTDDIISLGHSEYHFSLVFFYKGDWDQAIAHLRRSIKYLEKTEALFTLSLAWSMLGFATSFVGDLEAARRYVNKGLKMQTDAKIELLLSLHYLYSSSVYFEMGKFDNALNHAQTALDLSKKNKEAHLTGLSFILLGRTTGKKDPTKWNESRDFIFKGIRILQAQRANPFVSQGYLSLGELYADIGNKKEALENLKIAERMFKEMGGDYWLEKTQEILNRL